MVKEKIRGNLIVISGPSGCGKGTLCSELLKNNKQLFLSISMTTRSPREGEKMELIIILLLRKSLKNELMRISF